MLLVMCVVLCVAMDRLAALGIVIAIVSLSHASPQTVGTVEVEDRQIGIGAITGGKFGPGSFSIGFPGSSGQAHNKDESDGEHVVLSETGNNGDQREKSRPHQRTNKDEPNKSGGENRGDTVNAVKPKRPQSNPEQRGKGGQGGSGGGQIVIGTIVVPNNKKNKGSKRRNGNNKRRVSDTGALETIFGSNTGNNGVSHSENEYSNEGDQVSSIHIDAITGGNFEQGTLSIKNKQPTGVVPKKGSAVNKGNIGNTNIINETLHTTGHGANSNDDDTTGDGSANGPVNTGNDYVLGSNDGEERWIWSS